MQLVTKDKGLSLHSLAVSSPEITERKQFIEDIRIIIQQSDSKTTEKQQIVVSETILCRNILYTAWGEF